MDGSDRFEKLVNLDDEIIERRDMGKESFWDNDTSIVLSYGGSLADDVTNVVDDILQTLVTILAFLGDDTVVRRRLQGTLDSQMRGLFTHETDEVPVLDSRGTVRKHVSNKLRIDFRGSIKSNCGLEVVVMNISVDSGWDSDNSSLSIISLEEFSEVESICHGSSGADDNETSKAKSIGNLKGLLLLLISSNFVSTSADIVVSTKVDVKLEVFAGHDLAVSCHKTIDSVDEANKLNVGALFCVSKKTINNVVASWSLATHEDETNFLRFLFVNIKHLLVERREFCSS